MVARGGMKVGCKDALENNQNWNCTMLHAHGIPYESTVHWWLTKERVPPYRSNFVTRTPDGTEEQLAQIGQLVADPPADRWGIADSFACLDADALQALGLGVLFVAHWFGRIESNETPEETDTRFVRVQDEEGLAAWENSWQEWSPAPGMQIFPPTLLDTPD